MPDRVTLVVGTTPDYIAYIHGRYPGRAIFLTESKHTDTINSAIPGFRSVIFADLSNTNDVIVKTEEYLKKNKCHPEGIIGFDCEWLILTAELAVHFDLPYPSVEAVRLARDKYLTKKIWIENGVRAPRIELVRSLSHSLRLTERFGRPVVLKPLTGSGSELTFKCNDPLDLARAYRFLTDGLTARKDSPMYRDSAHSGDIHPTVLAEEFIDGREYSADFIVENDNVKIIRIAKKLADENLPFGTTTAYIIPARLPGWLNEEILREKLYQAAKTLGFNRAICMVDFIIDRDEIVFLELTPRIGGDCLPMLVKLSSGLNSIGLALDWAEGKRIDIPHPEKWTRMVGLRLFADTEGIIESIDISALKRCPEVKEISLKYNFPHKVILPPDDYDSHLLGHIIFVPDNDKDILDECNRMISKVKINMEMPQWSKIAG